MRRRRVRVPTVVEGGSDAPSWPWVEALLGTRRWAAASTVLVEREGVVLGVAIFRVTPPDAELLALVTEPNHRHRGLGRLLVAEVARRAKSAGCERLGVRLARREDAAADFFRRLGFEDLRVALDLLL